MAERVLLPELIDDLHKDYRADLFQGYVAVLEDWADELKGEERASVAQRIERACLEALELSDSPEVFEDAYRDLAKALGWQGRSGEVESVLREAIARLRSRVRDAEAGVSAMDPLRERKALVKVLVSYAEESGLSDDAELEAFRVAFVEGAGLGPRAHRHFLTAAKYVAELRERGLVAQAEGVLGPLLDGAGYGDERIAKAAVRLAMDRGDMGVAEERLRLISSRLENAHADWVAELREDLEEERRARQQR